MSEQHGNHRASSWLAWLPRAVVLLALSTSVALLPRPALAAAAANSVSETAEEQARRAAEIYKTTMSPFCPGRTIDACPSPYATEWREDIRKWVGDGVATDEIRRRLKQRTEKDLTGAPSTALDSVMPVLATVSSLVLLGLLLRLLVRPTPPVAIGAADDTEASVAAKRSSATGEKQGRGSPAKKATDQELDDRLERELDQLE